MELPSFLLSFFEWLLRWGDVIGTLGSILLSTVLAYLYYQQHQLLKIERNPSIEVSDRDFDGDNLDLFVSNYGSGLAKNLRVQTELEFPEDEDRGTLRSERRLNRIEDGERLLERAIGSEQRGVHFRGTPSFPQNKEVTCANFSTGVRALVNREDIREVKFQLNLLYDTQLGETRQEQILLPERWVRLDDESIESIHELGGFNLEEMWSRGGLSPPAGSTNESTSE